MIIPNQPSSYPLITQLTVEDDDDDNDICPVCDGECTCAVQPRLPLSMAQLSASTSPSTTAVQSTKPLLPPLKIKLTVPQGMRDKTILQSSSSYPKDDNTDPFSHTYVHQQPLPHHPQHPPQKRRGRPPKAVVAARQLPGKKLLADAHEVSTLQSQSSRSLNHLKHKKIPPKPPLSLKGRPTIKKSGPAKRRRVSSSDSSDLSDTNNRYGFGHFDDDDDDALSGRFPTFVSASALSSHASSSDAESSELSSLDESDSSIEAEEENFIVSEMEGRARVRRELFGDDVPKKRDPHNAWVIRPRKKSVGPSDAEMDIDSDATEDEDNQDEEDGDEEKDDDDDDDDDDDGDQDDNEPRYNGFATGWSEEEDESSFDADLFFANLSDSDANSASSASDGEGDDGDHSDMESIMASVASLPEMPPELQIQERWDGQIVFTNGLREGQGMLDRDFEVHAASFAESSPSPNPDSDVEMSDVDDEGYEQDADEGDGETTDEELVGEDDLPNERAMRMFNTPFSVSSINPMSTMSPAVSPGPRNRWPFSRSVDSPKPADILSGKVFWDSDDQDEFEEESMSHISSIGQGPRRGDFLPSKDSRQAIIDDLHADVPSPHPRFRRRQPSFVHMKSVEQMLQQTFVSHSPITCAPSPLHLIASSADKAVVLSPDMAPTVDLNDVLESSFLDAEPSDSQNTSTDSESKKHVKALNRWDLVSVGAFRQSREGAEGRWALDSTPNNKTDYATMMKSSPLSTMLWHNKSNTSPRLSRKMSVIISPVILPVRDHDGDRTPTNIPPARHQKQMHDNNSNKTRKELRRERKLKRKSYGAVHNSHQRHQHHNHHQHHPNNKSRSTNSSQRTNFFSSVPPLNL
ncbi:hypothetical protein H0H93_016693 [Arthromyces matolae]|nr:hypothetical protein H0H93_016693 [Arthromyces matolae]